MSLHLTLIPGRWAACRLPASAEIPDWATRSTVFWNLTRTRDELSILCPEEDVPPEIRHQGNWCLLRFEGPFEFSATGVLASVADPLAAAGVSLLAIATYDTDYVFLPGDDLEKALAALADAGHHIHRP
ncbi:MAG: ACT domain-containing protein [Acidobacteriota bacterium]